jgi:hypothetical protein
VKRDEGPVERNAEQSPSEAIAREERYLAELVEEADRTRAKLITNDGVKPPASAVGI